MDHLSFRVEEDADTPVGSPLQAIPYINGERLTVLLGVVEIGDDGGPFDAFIGLDPNDVFPPAERWVTPIPAQPGGETRIMRCSCGDEYCSYIATFIEVADDFVFWRKTFSWKHPRIEAVRDFCFSRAQYEEALESVRS